MPEAPVKDCVRGAGGWPKALGALAIVLAASACGALGYILWAALVYHDWSSNLVFGAALGLVGVSAVLLVLAVTVGRRGQVGRVPWRVVCVACFCLVAGILILVGVKEYRRHTRALERATFKLVYLDLWDYAYTHDGNLPDTLAAVVDDPAETSWTGPVPAYCPRIPLSGLFFAPYTHRDPSMDDIASGEFDFVYVGDGLRMTWLPPWQPTVRHIGVPAPAELADFSTEVGGRSVSAASVVILHSKPELLHGWCNVVFLTGNMTTVKGKDMVSMARKYGWVYAPVENAASRQ